jgi:hypothetical protein
MSEPQPPGSTKKNEQASDRESAMTYERALTDKCTIGVSEPRWKRAPL